MGLIKEIKRLGVKNLRGYEKALGSGKYMASGNFEYVMDFFKETGTKASDFPSEVVHKNLLETHKVFILSEKIQDDVLHDRLNSFHLAVAEYFNYRDRKDHSQMYRVIEEAYSLDDASIGCQSARKIYAEALTVWSQRNVSDDGQGHFQNVNTVVGLYKEAMKNLVVNGHTEEATQMFNQFRENKFTKFVISYKYEGNESDFYAHIAGSNLHSDDADRQKFGGFLVEQLSGEGNLRYVRNFSYSSKLLLENVSIEKHVELLDVYVNGSYRGNRDFDEIILKIVNDSLKTENGVCTKFQEKVSELADKYSSCFGTDGRAEIRKTEIEEIRKGNPLMMNKYLKDYSSFIHLCVDDNSQNTVKNFAVRLSKYDNGNETPAKPFVVNILMNEVERVAEKEDNLIDVIKDREWFAVADAVEAVASTGSQDDNKTLKTLYELQIKRHKNNTEFIENCVSHDLKNDMMKNESRLICGALEVLAQTNQKLLELRY